MTATLEATMIERREVTAADCVAALDDAVKDLNPYQRELFYQRLERALDPNRRKPKCVILPFPKANQSTGSR
jgi:hypothetical protein